MTILPTGGVFENWGSGNYVPLTAIIQEFNLKLQTEQVDISEVKLLQANINRPALQLAGFFDYFDATRLQIIGKVEHTYLTKLNPIKREENLRIIFQRKIPAIVLCHDLPLFPEMLGIANEYNVPILSSDWATSDFISEIIRWMKIQLAPRITMHGCLLDVYGVGILITGESGVGKSETSLELIKRGHRFIADDAVEIRRVSSVTLIGSCPENIRYFLELRGIGIVDIMQMFGVQSIKPTQTIELVLNLEFWDNSKIYERIGVPEEFTDILGIPVNSHNIPVRPGRSLAVICESAAINHRQKKMGYNASEAFTNKMSKKVGGNS